MAKVTVFWPLNTSDSALEGIQMVRVQKNEAGMYSYSLFCPDHSFLPRFPSFRPFCTFFLLFSQRIFFRRQAFNWSVSITVFFFSSAR